jgi:PKD repeat protein
MTSWNHAIASAFALILPFGAALRAGAACPATSPGNIALVIQTDCGPSGACPNGPIAFDIRPFPSGGFPPAPYDPGYTIEPCDTVTWSFGDGTTQVVTGTAGVTHDYPAPGNHEIVATVANALGAKSVTYSAVVATSPSRLGFVTRAFGFSAGNGRTSVCDACVEAHEGAGSVAITVVRTLDLSRTVTAEALVAFDPTWVQPPLRVPLQFAPNETEKTFTVPIANDEVYSGPRYASLGFDHATGGTLTRVNTSFQPELLVLDDEPAPTLSLESSVAVLEGDAGLETVSIPVHLTAPMGVNAYASVFFDNGSAASSDFQAGSGLNLPAGQTSGAVRVAIRGDVTPGPDKAFHIWLSPINALNDPLFDLRHSTITILNDDAALSPSLSTVTAGTSLTLTLDIGSPYQVPVTAVLTSSAPTVAAVPASVLIPAGTTKVDVPVTAHVSGSSQISTVLPARTTQPATITVNPARRRTATH